MKLVLDTNIIISSFFWGGNPRKIMKRIAEGRDSLFISDEMLQEIFLVMSRPKFNVSSNHIIHFTNSIEEIAHKVPFTGLITGICRDSSDDKILECAFWGNVDFIVSGDNDLLSLKTFQEINILTAAEYLYKVRE